MGYASDMISELFWTAHHLEVDHARNKRRREAEEAREARRRAKLTQEQRDAEDEENLAIFTIKFFLAGPAILIWVLLMPDLSALWVFFWVWLGLAVIFGGCKLLAAWDPLEPDVVTQARTYHPVTYDPLPPRAPKHFIFTTDSTGTTTKEH
jgi:hypothetical protein